MTIKLGINEQTFDASGDDLENILAIRQAAIQAIADLEQKKLDRAALLDRLGITEAESQLLLS